MKYPKHLFFLGIAGLGLIGCGGSDDSASTSAAESPAPSAEISIPAGLGLGSAFDTLLQNALPRSESVAGEVQKLAQCLALKADSLGDETRAKLTETVRSLATSQDIEALGAVQQLSALQLSPDQKEIAVELKHAVEGYLLKQNFDPANPQYGGAVSAAYDALRSGNYLQAVEPVKKILESANLGDDQEDLLVNLLGEHGDKVKALSNAVDAISKGLGGFGKQ